MVTFIDGVPARGLYRKFKVRTVDNNDFAAMYEVLTRRFKRRSGDRTTIRRGRVPTCSSSTAARASSAWRSPR